MQDLRAAGLHDDKISAVLDKHLPGEKLSINRIAFLVHADKDSKGKPVTDEKQLLANLSAMNATLGKVVAQRCTHG